MHFYVYCLLFFLLFFHSMYLFSLWPFVRRLLCYLCSYLPGYSFILAGCLMGPKTGKTCIFLLVIAHLRQRRLYLLRP
jgi:hypothetical protein